MSKKPRGLGPSYLVSHSVPDDDDDNSAPRPQRPRRAPPQSPRSRTPRPSPSTGLLALLASFATPTIIPAHAAPAPVSPNALRTHPSPDAIPPPIYLDFLYPHSHPPHQQHPYSPSHAPEEPTDPPRRLKKPRSSVSTAGDCACVIPTKFEENDTGWMVAERWTLHGKTHPNVSNPSPTCPSPPRSLGYFWLGPRARCAYASEVYLYIVRPSFTLCPPVLIMLFPRPSLVTSQSQSVPKWTQWTIPLTSPRAGTLQRPVVMQDMTPLLSPFSLLSLPVASQGPSQLLYGEISKYVPEG